MKHRYFWLFPALLVLQLAACSTDHSAERNADRRLPVAPPAVADSLTNPPASTGYGLRAGLENAGNATALQPAKPHTVRPILPRVAGSHASMMSRYNRVAQVVEPATAPPTTLADATAPEDDDRPSGGVVATENTAPLAGLNTFLASGLPSVQEFVLRPERDTLLIGRQGTQLFVPADAWNVPLASGPVHVQLREYYSTPDIILAGLGTTAGNELLETGGMLNLTATSETGQPTTLRPGARVVVRMPTKQIKPEMQLFQGEATDTHVDWRLDSSATHTFRFDLNTPDMRRGRHRKRVHHKTLRDEWPEYLSSEHRQVRELLRASTYSAATMAKLRRGRKLSAQERAAVNAYNYFASHEQAGKLEKIRRLAEVEFTVDTIGATTNVKVRNGYDAELAAPVLAQVQTWQGWRPARLARDVRNNYGVQYQQLKRKEQAVGVVRTMITASGKILVTPPSWDVSATRAKQDLRAGLEKQALYQARVNATKARNDSIIRRGGQLPLANSAMPTAADLFYELSSSGLGWINCDRFTRYPQPLFTYELNTNTFCDRTMLVFRDSRTIMNGVPVTGTAQVRFDRVPTGIAATIVAVRWQDGQAYLAIQPTTLVAQPSSPALEYRPVNILELQTALATLN
jgi:hypothetical protein